MGPNSGPTTMPPINEDASVVLADLREPDIPRRGSIAIEEIDTALSAAATRAVRLAEGQPGDAVVWEEVEARTRDTASLSVTFLTFAVVAALITSVAIVVDSEVLLGRHRRGSRPPAGSARRRAGRSR